MKKPGCALLALISTNLFAKTMLYGEANANIQSVFTDNGSALVEDGSLSEVGFRSELVLDDKFTARSDFAVGVNLTDPDTPWLNKGSLGVTGEFGRVNFFYGNTPLTDSNDWLKLMSREPDFFASLLRRSAASAASVPVGINKRSGVAYHSPTVADAWHLAFAVLPAEEVDVESGFSLSAIYDGTKTRFVAGFEVNSEKENDQLFRLMSDTRLGSFTLGGGAQFAGNQDLDTSAYSFFGYGKWSMLLAGKENNLRLLTGLTQLHDKAGNDALDINLSLAAEQPWATKFSSYNFIQWQTADDRDTSTVILGAGLRLLF